ncbi:hypothetical protein Tco_1062343 [Tanacetum coccineum]
MGDLDLYAQSAITTMMVRVLRIATNATNLATSPVTVKECPKLKNNKGNRGNQDGKDTAPAKVYAVGRAGTNPDSNIMTELFISKSRRLNKQSTVSLPSESKHLWKQVILKSPNLHYPCDIAITSDDRSISPMKMEIPAKSLRQTSSKMHQDGNRLLDDERLSLADDLKKAHDHNQNKSK